MQRPARDECCWKCGRVSSTMAPQLEVMSRLHLLGVGCAKHLVVRLFPRLRCRSQPRLLEYRRVEE